MSFTPSKRRSSQLDLDIFTCSPQASSTARPVKKPALDYSKRSAHQPQRFNNDSRRFTTPPPSAQRMSMKNLPMTSSVSKRLKKNPHQPMLGRMQGSTNDAITSNRRNSPAPPKHGELIQLSDDDSPPPTPDQTSNPRRRLTGSPPPNSDIPDRLSLPPRSSATHSLRNPLTPAKERDDGSLANDPSPFPRGGRYHDMINNALKTNPNQSRNARIMSCKVRAQRTAARLREGSNSLRHRKKRLKEEEALRREIANKHAQSFAENRGRKQVVDLTAEETKNNLSNPTTPDELVTDSEDSDTGEAENPRVEERTTPRIRRSSNRDPLKNEQPMVLEDEPPDEILSRLKIDKGRRRNRKNTQPTNGERRPSGTSVAAIAKRPPSTQQISTRLISFPANRVSRDLPKIYEDNLAMNDVDSADAAPGSNYEFSAVQASRAKCLEEEYENKLKLEKTSVGDGEQEEDVENDRPHSPVPITGNLKNNSRAAKYVKRNIFNGLSTIRMPSDSSVKRRPTNRNTLEQPYTNQRTTAPGGNISAIDKARTIRKYREEKNNQANHQDCKRSDCKSTLLQAPALGVSVSKRVRPPERKDRVSDTSIEVIELDGNSKDKAASASIPGVKDDSVSVISTYKPNADLTVSIINNDVAKPEHKSSPVNDKRNDLHGTGDGKSVSDSMKSEFAALKGTSEDMEKSEDDIRLRALNPEERLEYTSLTKKVMKNEVLAVVKEARINLCGKDFSRLRGLRWLNDEIMNSFVALINVRNRKAFGLGDAKGGNPQDSDACIKERKGWLDDAIAAAADKSGEEKEIPKHGYRGCEGIFSLPRPRTHVFNTFFFERLQHGGYDYQGVRRWLQKAGRHIKDLDLIIVPINLDNFHWVVTVIDLRNKHIVYMDSMQGKDSADAGTQLRQWLMDEVADKMGKDVMDRACIPKFTFVVNPKIVPRQIDDGSCGIFVLYIAEFLERGKRPAFSQENISTLRQRTALFLKHGQLPNC